MSQATLCRAQFNQTVAEADRDSVLTEMVEVAHGLRESDRIDIYERTRRDALNVRVLGAITLEQGCFNFILEDGDGCGTQILCWERD